MLYHCPVGGTEHGIKIGQALHFCCCLICNDLQGAQFFNALAQVQDQGFAFDHEALALGNIAHHLHIALAVARNMQRGQNALYGALVLVALDF